MIYFTYNLTFQIINVRFRNINCQAPGLAHDAAVFKESNLFRHYKHLIPQVR